MTSPACTVPSPVVRWLRGWRPDGNPLRRTSDRVQALVSAGFVVIVLVLVPLVAVLTGRWADRAGIRAAATGSRPVSAILITNASRYTWTDYGGPQGPQARARWRAPDGRAVVGEVPVRAGARLGGTVHLWVGRTGRPAPRPPTGTQIAVQAFLVGAAAMVGLAAVLYLSVVLVGVVLERRRLAAWGAEWQDTEPLWTRLR